jgi:hypothetical protein
VAGELVDRGELAVLGDANHPAEYREVGGRALAQDGKRANKGSAIARVELQAGLGCPDDQRPAAARVDGPGSGDQRRRICLPQDPVVIVAALLMTSLPDFVLSELGPDAALAGAITYASHVALERLVADLDNVPAPGASAF